LAKDVPFEFDDACLQAFAILKKALISAPIIQPPDWSLPFEIMCDTSDHVVGVVLGQTEDKKLIGTDMNRHKGGPIFTIVDQKNKDNLLRTADN